MNHNYCSSCGMEVLVTMRICPRCGNRSFDSTQPAIQPSSTPPTAATSPLPNSNIYQAPAGNIGIAPGVKGWLLFFCISLTILTPLSALVGIIIEWNVTKHYFGVIPNLENAVMLKIFATIVLSIFSIYSGIQLWTVKVNAVSKAKKFLFVSLAFGLIVPSVFIAMVSLPNLISDAIKIAFGSIVHFAVWFLYLQRSKRIKATFS